MDVIIFVLRIDRLPSRWRLAEVSHDGGESDALEVGFLRLHGTAVIDVNFWHVIDLLYGSGESG